MDGSTSSWGSVATKRRARLFIRVSQVVSPATAFYRFILDWLYDQLRVSLNDICLMYSRNRALDFFCFLFLFFGTVCSKNYFIRVIWQKIHTANNNNNNWRWRTMISFAHDHITARNRWWEQEHDPKKNAVSLELYA